MINRFFSFALVWLLSCNAHAGTMGPQPIEPMWSGVITLTLGPDFLIKPSNQNLLLEPFLYNKYTLSAPNTLADGGGFVGIEHRLSTQLSSQIGIAGYTTANMPINGHVWQFGLPQFDNFIYHYHVTHQRLMVSGKLLTHHWQTLLPYISAEIGLALNHTNAYQEFPLLPEAVPMLPFAPKEHSSLTYGLGLGFDYALYPNLRLGTGYQFADLGQVSLGRSPMQLTNQRLHWQHRYTNQLRFQLTFLV